MDTRLSKAWQPIPLFPRMNWQAMMYIKHQILTEPQGKILDWMIGHLGLNNRVVSGSQTTIVKLLSREFGWANHDTIRRLLKGLANLDIIRKESSEIYVLNPYIVNRLGMIPVDAFGFRDKKIKALEEKGFRSWKIADDRRKKDIPSARIRLQTTKFRVIKEAETRTTPKDNGDFDMVLALEKISRLEDAMKDQTQKIQQLMALVERIAGGESVSPQEAKTHLTLVKK